MKKPTKSNALVVFLKNEDHGKVKTRIAQTMGHDSALEIYQRLQLVLHSLLSSLSQDILLYFSDRLPTDGMWATTSYPNVIQSKGDLGVRMSQAMEKTLSRYDSVVLIGSDCPYLSKEIIDEAYTILEHNDVVLGPALDGGYYLVGMNDSHPFLFENVAWSTTTVLEQTLDLLRNNKLSHGLLPVLSDIDTQTDWEAYLQSFK